MLDYIVYIGRFQPFHNNHLRVVREAQKKAKRVIVLVGGRGEPRTLRNPFTFTERSDMINFTLDFDSSVIIKPLYDYIYNDQRWLSEVRKTVQEVVDMGGTRTKVTIGIIVNKKDNSGSYNVDFPEYTAVPAPTGLRVRASDIRESLFSCTAHDDPMNGHMNIQEALGFVPPWTKKFVNRYMATEEYGDKLDEQKHIDNYSDGFTLLPWPPVFHTVDALVVQAGHILLVTRRGDLGFGKLALPGGFINHRETLESATIRELREESRLKVAEPVLKGSIKNIKTYDSPYRSELGRVITTVTHYELGAMPKLPRVQGADDASKAKWYPLNTLNRSEMFDDHFHIIQDMLGV